MIEDEFDDVGDDIGTFVSGELTNIGDDKEEEITGKGEERDNEEDGKNWYGYKFRAEEVDRNVCIGIEVGAN